MVSHTSIYYGICDTKQAVALIREVKTIKNDFLKNKQR